MGNEVSPTGSSSKTKKIKEVKVTSFEELESLATGQKEKPSEEPSEETQEEPVYGPERKYASMSEYQRDMGRKLFLEGKACLSDDQSEILAKEDWKVEWISGKERGLKIDIDLSNNFLDRFITKKQQIMGQLPFYRGQTMFFFCEDGLFWVGYVDSVYRPQVEKSAIKGAQKTFRMFIRVYDWDQNRKPKPSEVKSIQILPGCIATSRALNAMTTMSDKQITNMIMGKKDVNLRTADFELKFSNLTLNESQKRAVKSVMINPITILQGPPGTGKTCIISEMVSQLLKMDIYPILVVAASNTAVDNIAEKLLVDHRDSMLRLVAGVREKKYDAEHSLASVCLHSKVLAALPDPIKILERKLKDPREFITSKEYRKVLSTKIPISDKLVAKAKVILATTVVAGGPQFKHVHKMPAVIMDEATQSAEYSSLIPLAFMNTEKVVLVGDQKQLSGHAELPEVAVSLFERVIANETYKPEMILNMQYRMHPLISEFPRNTFYKDLLKDGITAANRQMKGIPAEPVVFYDTHGEHQESFPLGKAKDANKFSYCNTGEAEIVRKLLIDLVCVKGVSRSKIGVISPYGGQRALLSSIFVKDAKINNKKQKVQMEKDFDALDLSENVTINTVAGISISSIDAFQGREKDVIILSCVRSNANKRIGFVADPRRMNVALTRAKYGMIIVGDVDCLSKKCYFWKQYIATLEAKGAVLGC
ncbi:hypothetical protein OXX79_003429 [Metschnikowia pulcherrima]